ncbi:MAG: C-terminal target protein, partial [Bacteroidota bacterium]|nr:C-terminal target protein [Bacteroidota bacterium]
MPMGLDVDVKGKGDVFVGGYFSDTLNFTGCGITANGQAGFIIQFDSRGACKCIHKVEKALPFALRLNGTDVVTAGLFSDTAVFDLQNLITRNYTDIYVASSKECYVSTEISTDMSAEVAGIGPNPNSGLFKIFAESKNYTQIDIYNLMGQLVRHYNFVPLNSEIDISLLPSGVYLLSLKSSSLTQAIRVIKNQ